ncbi:methylated-DNA--[protein]-cysteine S-methyltransferase [Aquincola sp. S2]|uniref:Methylated-DNA--protein-cysteine methyltransferase n=1 Tax=Pseudaquabacterium terrae TaxID=2732868 RepID=A0ABX2EEV2_9BURK|nr:methylated-DNA--[protein]-cysteine S-methyltransferase [Aquabacterium terrae]NRF67157.1 methylated-DNA--[protein]-cysteine S-methyltransferase [Aquabacterium terrae]
MKLDITAQARLDTPMGPMTAAASERGLVGLWFDGQAHHPGPLDAPLNPQQRWLRAARCTLDAYFAGHDAAGELQLDLQGTPFQQAVWQQLLALERGATCSYSTLAERAGVPHAVRAVGAAVGRNPVSVLVPCHRVLGRSGALTGYAGGLDRKRALLALEQARAEALTA